MKQKNKVLNDFLAKYGINPDAPLVKEKRKYVDKSTFIYPIGTVVREIASEVIAEITGIEEYKGIMLKILNRRDNTEIVDWQQSFEQRIEEGYLEIIKKDKP
jgi:hypothetical protein